MCISLVGAEDSQAAEQKRANTEGVPKWFKWFTAARKLSSPGSQDQGGGTDTTHCIGPPPTDTARVCDVVQQIL